MKFLRSARRGAFRLWGGSRLLLIGETVASYPGNFEWERSMDLFRIRENELWGAIDLHGALSIQCSFLELGEFQDGVAAASRDGVSYGLIDVSGQWACEPNFRMVGPDVSGERIPASQKETGRWGFINRKGDWLVDPVYQSANPYFEGFACVKGEFGTFGFIDEYGNQAFPFDQPSSSLFSGALVLSERHQKFGFRNSEGLYAIPPIYSTADHFSEGFASVGLNGRFYLIDANGERRSSEFVWVDSVHFGVVRIEKERGVFAIYDVGTERKSGEYERINPIAGKVTTAFRGGWKLISVEGEIGDLGFVEECWEFNDGLCEFKDRGANGLYGFLDDDGKVAIQPQFIETEGFFKGAAKVRDDDGLAYISRTGEIIYRYRSE